MNKHASKKALRLLLSSGLVVSSAAYAFWQHSLQAAGPATAAAPPPLGGAGTPPSQQQAAVTPAETRPVKSAPAASPPSQQANAAPDIAPRVSSQARQENIAPDAQSAPPVRSAAPAIAPPPAAPPEPAAPLPQLADSSAGANIAVALQAPAAPRRAVYADGEFTGAAADTAWGDVQVKVVIKNGAMTKVDTLDYPDHRSRSVEINEWALPQLQQEAITAQTARIDLVSQATVTSYGYQASLGAALAQARAQANKQ